MRKLIPLVTIVVVAVAALALLRCEALTGDKPTNVTLTAPTDSTVKITWTAPSSNPDKYIIKFKETGTSSFTNVDTVTTTEATLNPSGKTGTYTVVAMFGSNDYESEEVKTTPISTAEKTVGELNAADLAGYGWSRTTGDGATYTMKQASSAASVDFYITDFATGYSGPTYSIASPSQGPTDPGNVVPSGSWRVSSFTNALADPQAALPTHSNTTYFNYTDLSTDPTYVGCYTAADGYYALVKFSGFNTTNGTVKVESWFQLVKGLRLIEH